MESEVIRVNRNLQVAEKITKTFTLYHKYKMQMKAFELEK